MDFTDLGPAMREAGMRDDIDRLATKVRTMEDLPDIRVVGCMIGTQVYGTMIQRAMRCREDGKIEWRNVPIQWLSKAEYDRITS